MSPARWAEPPRRALDPFAHTDHGAPACVVRPPKCEVCRERVPGNRCEHGRCLDCHAKWCATEGGHERRWPGERVPNAAGVPR